MPYSLQEIWCEWNWEKEKKKYRVIFVELSDESAGWLFHVSEAKRSFVSIDAVFGEDFTTPLCTSDFPLLVAIKRKNLNSCRVNHDAVLKNLNGPNGRGKLYNNDGDIPLPKKIDVDDETSVVQKTKMLHLRRMSTYMTSFLNQDLFHKSQGYNHHKW